MIVVYSPRSRRVRLTYLQAKSERLTTGSVCGHRFSANLEQWFLLSTRPTINGVGSFAPPADLLSGALLPSVGTFAFFFKDPAGHFEIYYAAASFLAPAGTYGQRYGTLAASGPCHSRFSNGFQECLAACGSFAFAEALHRMEIGTPIDPTMAPSAGNVRLWLVSNLRAAQSTSDRRGLAEELSRLLMPEVPQADHPAAGHFGARSVLVLRTEYPGD